MLDTTINLGTLIQIVSYIVAFTYFIWTIKTRLEVMDTKQATLIDKIGDIQIELDKLTEVTIEQARQNTRLDHLEARILELARR